MLSVAKHLVTKCLYLWYNEILQLANARFRMTDCWRTGAKSPYASETPLMRLLIAAAMCPAP